jgi:hypothetical protein
MKDLMTQIKIHDLCAKKMINQTKNQPVQVGHGSVIVHHVVPKQVLALLQQSWTISFRDKQ